MFQLLGIAPQALFGQLLIGLINGSFYALLSLGLAVIFTLTLPATLGSRFHLAEVKGASFQRVGGKVAVAPEAKSWQAVWKG